MAPVLMVFDNGYPSAPSAISAHAVDTSEQVVENVKHHAPPCHHHAPPSVEEGKPFKHVRACISQRAVVWACNRMPATTISLHSAHKHTHTGTGTVKDKLLSK